MRHCWLIFHCFGVYYHYWIKMNTLIQRAIERGLITPASTEKPKRGPKPRPIPELIAEAIKLWEQQMTLEEVCEEIGVNINTFRWYYYKRPSYHNRNRYTKETSK